MKYFWHRAFTFTLLFACGFNGCKPTILEPNNIATVSDSARIVRALTANGWKLTKVTNDAGSVNNPNELAFFDTTRDIRRYQQNGTFTNTVFNRANTITSSTTGTWQITSSVFMGRQQWVLKETIPIIYNNGISEKSYYLWELSSLKLTLAQDGHHGPISYLYEPE